MDKSDEQPENAASSMQKRRERASKATVERASHPLKQQRQSFSTDEGRQIDDSNEQSENAKCSIEDS
jgi:hypothetical protein